MVSHTKLKIVIAEHQFLITESLKFILQNDERFFVSRTLSEKKELNSYGITNIILKTSGKEEITEALDSLQRG